MCTQPARALLFHLLDRKEICLLWVVLSKHSLHTPTGGAQDSIFVTELATENENLSPAFSIRVTLHFIALDWIFGPISVEEDGTCCAWLPLRSCSLLLIQEWHPLYEIHMGLWWKKGDCPLAHRLDARWHPSTWCSVDVELCDQWGSKQRRQSRVQGSNERDKGVLSLITWSKGWKKQDCFVHGRSFMES